MSEERDLAAISIDNLLKNSSYTPLTPCIYRVSHHLRSTNGKVYDPMKIAIGPYHHGKDHLKEMEKLKITYLKKSLEYRQEPNSDRYVKVIRNLEKRALECYAEVIRLEEGEFVKMLLLDGIFIIEFLREYDLFSSESVASPTFQVRDVVYILNDLVLFENQIPFFVLKELFDLLKIHDHEEITDLIWPLLFPSERQKNRSSPTDVDHLLGLVHYANCLSFASRLCSQGDKLSYLENINSATKLKEAGIIFTKPRDEGTSLLDIQFENNEIHVPLLEISDITEPSFRNMIAYEDSLPHDQQKYITDYVFFLHCLIHSPNDAELLRHKGIIKNWLGAGGDENVYLSISQMGTNVQTSERFSYTDVFRSINHYCRRRTNWWIAALRRDHFKSPWTFISLVAGFTLISVTIVQTVFTILSWKDKK